MKKLGICIDGVVRDIHFKFDQIYRKKFIKNPGLVQMNDNFEYAGEDEDENQLKLVEHIEKEKIHLPVSTYDLMNHYEFDSYQDFIKFQNEDYVLELYGTAPPFAKSMDISNRLQYMCEDQKMFSTYFICPGDDQIVTSTFYFLTKNASRIKNIVFRNYSTNLWEEFDVLITDSPDILSLVPENKCGIKLNKLYNSNCPATFSIDSLADINTLEKMQEIYKIINK